MRVLVACEFSGRVREAFRARGHEAWSCDLFEPAEDASPYHYADDAVRVAYAQWWDMLIAFPPCTHLAASGAKHFAAKRADGRQREAIEFFLQLAHAPVPRIAIENPVGVITRAWRAPDQVLQPWQFGHGETKATCLWLKGLPPLRPTNVVAGRSARSHFMADTLQRWKNRSRTYPGIAQAMAEQWGGFTDLVTAMELPQPAPTMAHQP